MKTCFFSLVLLVGFSLTLRAQQEDMRGWLSASESHKLIKRVKMTNEIQLRLSDNLSSFSSAFFESTVRYKLTKKIAVGQVYRFSKRQVGIEQRLTSYVSHKFKPMKRLTLSQKVKYQHDFIPKDLDENRLRYRWALGYNIKKSPWSPFVSNEWFYLFDYKRSFISRVRVRAGVDYKINKKMSLNFSTTRQWQLQQAPAANSFIFNAGFKYDF